MNDRGDLVHEPVREVCNRADTVADQLQPPSAPPSLGSRLALGLTPGTGGADGGEKKTDSGMWSVMRGQLVPGPGTVRVRRFIGRVGVVSMPAVAVGLGLDERVVRRHVAKLEAAGWLSREPWVFG